MYLGRRRVLVVRPDSRAYGHEIVHVLMGLYMARAAGAESCVMRPSEPANPALYQLASPDVPIIPPDGWRAALLRGFWHAAECLDALRSAVGWPLRLSSSLIRRALVRGASSLSRDSRMPKRLRGRLKTASRALSDSEKVAKSPPVSEQEPYFGLNFWRLYARDSIRVCLSADQEKVAVTLGRELGLTSETKIVTLHVRGSTARDILNETEREIERERDASIESYYEAIDFLVSRGYTVVRLGDPTMAPIARRGLVDLATWPDRSGALELWCISKSDFFIACDSGPYSLGRLLNTPCLAVNVTNVTGAYPVCWRDMYILKRAIDCRTGHTLTLDEMVTEDYLLNRRRPGRFRYIENTSEEILEAVRDMLTGLSSDNGPSPAQRQYKDLISTVVRSPMLSQKWAIKRAPELSFTGDGHIGAGFADRNLHQRHELEATVVGAR